MITVDFPLVIVVGKWCATRATGELIANDGHERLEPKVMDLLFLLASRPGETFSKDEIMGALWPDVVVGDDSLARAISRLRKALGDDTKTPLFIETLPKRGYRLVAPVRRTSGKFSQPSLRAPLTSTLKNLRSPTVIIGASTCALVVAIVLAFGWLLPSRPALQTTGTQTVMERANDFYFQYKRADNEAAVELFERLLTQDPDYAPALAGLANALVQKVIRWPDEPGAVEYTKLGDALRNGRTTTPAAKQLLARAHALAERAVHIAPNDAASLKALGFVQSANRNFDAAIATYEKAVALDKDAWGPLINIGDVLEISGHADKALPYFEAAYAAMSRVYDKQAARVRPWHGELGVVIGDRHKARGELQEAEAWYRRVLSYAPLHPVATAHLADILRETGNPETAEQLCANLERRIRRSTECARHSE